jgi:hypothetical protein
MNRRTLTSRETFGNFALFSVNPGVPARDALEQASNLLSCVESLATDIGGGTAQGSDIFALQYLVEMARALVDATHVGISSVEGGQ